MNLRVAVSSEVKGDDAPSRSEGEREQRAEVGRGRRETG